MPYESITTPTITIHFQSMKHAIMEHMAMHTKDMQATLDSELDSVIKDFDFRGYIRSIAEPLLRDTIKKSLERAMSDLIYDNQDFRPQVRDLVADVVRDMFKNMK